MEVSLQAQQRRRVRVSLAVWGILALLLALLREVLFPFLMGALLAYLLAPLVRWLSTRTFFGRRLPSAVALVLIYALGIGLVVLAARLVLPNLYRETLRLAARSTAGVEGVSERIRSFWPSAQEWLQSHGLPSALGEQREEVSGLPSRFDLGEALRRWPDSLRGRFFEFFGIGQRLVRQLFGAVFTGLLILMSAAFFLLGRAEIVTFVRRLLPDTDPGGFERLLGLLDRRLSGVVRGQVTICLVNGALTLVGLLLFRVEFPFVLAAQATGFSLIPIFGTFVSSVPIVIIALQQGVPVGLSMFAWILAIHALEAYVLNPKILGGAARIHPLVILFALVAGEHYFGIWGAFLATPVAAVAVAAFEQAEAWAEGPG